MAKRYSPVKDVESDIRQLVAFVLTLKIEGLVQAALMAVLTYKIGQSLWFLPITFLVFDAFAIGYMINAKIGALFYNIGHSSILPTILLIIGILTNSYEIKIWTYSWLFHVGVDRALGYGLKHKTSFKHTHLGKL
jgi:Domain of unknown function (DUF4260)